MFYHFDSKFFTLNKCLQCKGKGFDERKKSLKMVMNIEACQWKYALLLNVHLKGHFFFFSRMFKVSLILHLIFVLVL